MYFYFNLCNYFIVVEFKIHTDKWVTVLATFAIICREVENTLVSLSFPYHQFLYQGWAIMFVWGTAWGHVEVTEAGSPREGRYTSRKFLNTCKLFAVTVHQDLKEEVNISN
jgi:hypothetical protein